MNATWVLDGMANAGEYFAWFCQSEVMVPTSQAFCLSKNIVISYQQQLIEMLQNVDSTRPKYKRIWQQKIDCRHKFSTQVRLRWFQEEHAVHEAAISASQVAWVVGVEAVVSH